MVQNAAKRNSEFKSPIKMRSPPRPRSPMRSPRALSPPRSPPKENFSPKVNVRLQFQKQHNLRDAKGGGVVRGALERILASEQVEESRLKSKEMSHLKQNLKQVLQTRGGLTPGSPGTPGKSPYKDLIKQVHSLSKSVSSPAKRQGFNSPKTPSRSAVFNDYAASHGSPRVEQEVEPQP